MTKNLKNKIEASDTSISKLLIKNFTSTIFNENTDGRKNTSNYLLRI